MNILIILYQIVGFLLALSVHEAAHAYIAYRKGDSTAYRMGRVTLNPVPHIDLVGTILLPAILILSRAGIVIGWAKPVPVNPYNFRNPRRDNALVALAGPAANFITAACFFLLLRLLYFGLSIRSEFIVPLFVSIAAINIFLGLFNLIPIPPLDGSHILESFLKGEALNQYQRIFQFPIGMIIIIVLINIPYFDSLLIWVARAFSKLFLGVPVF